MELNTLSIKSLVSKLAPNHSNSSQISENSQNNRDISQKKFSSNNNNNKHKYNKSSSSIAPGDSNSIGGSSGTKNLLPQS